MKERKSSIFDFSEMIILGFLILLLLVFSDPIESGIERFSQESSGTILEALPYALLLFVVIEIAGKFFGLLAFSGIRLREALENEKAYFKVEGFQSYIRQLESLGFETKGTFSAKPIGNPSAASLVLHQPETHTFVELYTSETGIICSFMSFTQEGRSIESLISLSKPRRELLIAQCLLFGDSHPWMRYFINCSVVEVYAAHIEDKSQLSKRYKLSPFLGEGLDSYLDGNIAKVKRAKRRFSRQSMLIFAIHYLLKSAFFKPQFTER